MNSLLQAEFVDQSAIDPATEGYSPIDNLLWLKPLHCVELDAVKDDSGLGGV